MLTALVTHEACLAHDTGQGHPERADRLREVLDALDPCDLLRKVAPRATLEQLSRVHDEAYLRWLLAIHLGKGAVAHVEAYHAA